MPTIAPDSKYGRRIRLAGLTTEAILAPAIGVWAGMFLDQRYNWSPWATLGGLVLGGVITVRLFIQINRMIQQDE